MNVNVNGAVITDLIAETLLELQRDSNDVIDSYLLRLSKVSDYFFKVSNEMDVKQPKDEIFELLNYIHLLQKDLKALKVPNNRLKECTE
ncbi:MAG: hypothetical protein LBV71_13120 [Prevotella sp.]|nr:hypothetical protein [Prevotella sp.]